MTVDMWWLALTAGLLMIAWVLLRWLQRWPRWLLWRDRRINRETMRRLRAKDPRHGK